MSAIEYTVSPNTAGVSLSAESFTADKVTVKIDSIDVPTLHLKPAGNVGQKILSGIVWPIAQLLALSMPKKLKEKTEGKTFSHELDNSIGYTFTVESVDITISPDQVNLSTYTPYGSTKMLMAAGTVKVK